MSNPDQETKPLYLEQVDTLDLFAYDPVLARRADMRSTDRKPDVAEGAEVKPAANKPAANKAAGSKTGEGA